MNQAAWPGVIEAYRSFLPVDEDSPVVTLYEGGTPLVPAPRLSEELGAEIYLKFEGMNPTGSFKDRGMTMAISQAKREGATAVICASTGNTSAAAAAYAARAGMTAAVIVPSGKVALGKLSQALIHGAKVVQIDKSFDAALDIVRELGERGDFTVVNSINPYRLQGQKTASFEVVDVLGDAPDLHCLPVGNAGNITAYWMGYKEYFDAGLSSRLPRMHGFQAQGAAPLVYGQPVDHPETVATAIRIGHPASWDGAIEARDASGGSIEAVTDSQILEMFRWLPAHEGVFVEPASAASVAGVAQLHKAGRLPKGAKVVCTVTGHGLKDPNQAISQVAGAQNAESTADAVAEAILGS